MRPRPWAHAAAAALLVGIGVWFVTRRPPEVEVRSRAGTPAVTAPEEVRQESVLAPPRAERHGDAPPRPIGERLREAIRLRDRAALRALAQELLDSVTPAKTADDLNAARTYREAFEKLVAPSPAEESAWTALLEDRATPEQKTQLLSYLEKNADALRLLREAAAKPECNFHLEYAQGWELELPHLSPMIRSAKLLGLATRLLEEDRTSTLLAAHRLSEAFGGEPLLLSQIVRGVTIGIGTGAAESAIGRASEAELSRILASTDAAELRDDARRAVLGELAITLLHWDNAIPDDPAPYAELMLDVHDLLARPYAESRDALEDLQRRAAMLESNPYLPNIGSFAQRVAAGESRRTAVRLAVSVRLFRLRKGYDPVTLEEMRAAGLDPPSNPLTGRAFDYRLDGSGFVISGGEGVELRVR